MTRKKPVQVWFEILRDAKTYEEWNEAALTLDALLLNDLWYASPTQSLVKGILIS